MLTGVLGSLLGQGVAAPLAARAAAFLQGLAADWASHDPGERGLIPSDLFRYLPPWSGRSPPGAGGIS